MFQKHIAQLTESQLKNRNRLCLGIAIGFLLGMLVFLFIALKQTSDQDANATFTALMLALLMPLVFIPLLYSSALNKEIKRRKTNDRTLFTNI